MVIYTGTSRRGRRFSAVLAGVLSAGLGPTVLIATASAQVPPSAQPGQIQQQLQPPTPPTPTPGITVPERPDLTPPPGATQQTFTLGRLDVVGSTVYTPEQLQQFATDRLGRQISLADLYTIANNITRQYRQDGYLLSQAVVPAQTIDGGVARLQVVEGFVETVRFQGGSEQIRKRLEGFGERISQEKPLTQKKLERYLLLADDLAGVKLQGVLSPGSKLGAALLTVRVEVDRFDPFVQLTNRGSDAVGPLRLQAGLFLNSALGLGERFTFSGATNPAEPSELQFAQGGLSLPVGYEGLRVDVTGSYTHVKPGDVLEPFDLRGESSTVGLEATYPLIRSRRQNLYLSGRLDFTDSKNFTLLTGNPQFLSDDKIRALRFGVRYDRTDRSGQTAAGFQISQGLPILGATTSGSLERPLSQFNGSAVFTKVNFEASRLQTLPAQFNLLLLASAQASGNTLLSPEQFALGGASCGSAFIPATVLGDSGYCLRAEVQRPISFRWQKMPLVTQPYAFADVGQAFLNSPTAAQRGTNTLASTGFGVRQYLGNSVNLGVELAFPIERTDNSFTNSPRLFFTIQGTF